MSIAATVTTTNLRSISTTTTTPSSYPLTTPFKLNTLKFTSSTIQNLKFRPLTVTAMSVASQQTLSKTAFLDRTESGTLHFVKYHGLGNDFILVIRHIFNFISFVRTLFIVRKNCFVYFQLTLKSIHIFKCLYQ